jgi:hypothetical protein
MTKITGSGSIGKRHGSADPDQNVTDPQHCSEPDQSVYGYLRHLLKAGEEACSSLEKSLLLL